MKKVWVPIAIMMVLAQNSAFAYRLEFTPSLSAALNWTDNVESVSTDPKSDSYLSVGPRFIIRGKSDRSSLFVDARGSAEVYQKFEEFNDIGTSRITVSYDRNVSKIILFKLWTSAFFTPRAETSEEIVATLEGPEQTPILTAITERTDRYGVSAYPSLTYLFSPRLSTTVTGGFRTIQYTEDIGFTEFETYSGGARLDYVFSRKLTGGIGLNYSETDFDLEGDSEVISGNFSGRYRYRPNVFIDFLAGASYLSQDNEDNTFNFIGEIGAAAEFKRTYINIKVSSSLEEGTFGGFTERNTVRAWFVFPFFKRGTWSLGGSFSERKSFDDDEDLDIYEASTNVKYPILSNLTIFAGGKTEKQDDRSSLGQDLEINSVFVGFDLSVTFKEKSVYR